MRKAFMKKYYKNYRRKPNTIFFAVLGGVFIVIGVLAFFFVNEGNSLWLGLCCGAGVLLAALPQFHSAHMTRSSLIGSVCMSIPPTYVYVLVVFILHLPQIFCQPSGYDNFGRLFCAFFQASLLHLSPFMFLYGTQLYLLAAIPCFWAVFFGTLPKHFSLRFPHTGPYNTGMR